MNHYPQQLAMLLSATAILVAPSYQTASAQVQAVQLQATAQGFQIKLATDSNQSPQIFTIKRGKVLVADLTNTQLNLGGNNTIKRDDPFPGVDYLTITQKEANQVRVIVQGTNEAPNAQIESVVNGELILNVVVKSNVSSTEQQQQPLPQQTPQLGNQPEVMFPNPEITINGEPAQNNQPSSPGLRPTLPRAVAPPVGDIAVSTINSSPEQVNLGTDTRIPRLVLREAPVREVLSLLARSANLNLIFADQSTEGDNPAQQTISVDIENESVQQAFNSILQLSQLQANRRGNTIFVGATLPQGVRTIMTQSLRLNQVTVSAASGFLASQGAEVQQVVTPVEREFNQETGALIRETEQPAQLRPLTVNQPDTARGALLLRGLSVSTDERLNAITLIGEPRQIEIAVDLLKQLDARRRQVSINVKIIDVNLNNTDDFEASFSFGINDSFFVSDSGAATLSFGGGIPPSGPQVINSPITPTVINNPFAGANTFVNFDETQLIPGTDPGQTVINEITGEITTTPRGALNFFTRTAGVSENPLEAGLTDFTLAENQIVTISQDDEGNLEFNVSEGSLGTATSGLPSLFQFPTDFLALLEAQVTSGNAKILTDPTLLIQEGQTAGVNLTQEVVGNITRETESSEGITTITTTAEIQEAGLQLNVNVQRVDDNGFITLNVNPTVTSIGSVQNLNIGGDDNQIALLNKRELNSGEIRLRDGQTLIIAGIIQDEDRTTVTKVPILGDLPIIGSLFRSTQRENVRQEVIVLLTPNILNDSLEAGGYGVNYQPSPAAREMLQQRGYPIPQRRE